MNNRKLTALIIILMLLVTFCFVAAALKTNKGSDGAADGGDDGGEDGTDGGDDDGGEEIVVNVDLETLAAYEGMFSGMLGADPGHIGDLHIDDEEIVCVPENLIGALREIGGIPMEYEHSYDGDAKCTRVNVTVIDGDASKVFIFASDDVNTYELVMTGFFGVKEGGDPGELTPATSLTFFATEEGVYVILFELVDLENGCAVLEKMTFTVTVGPAPEQPA